MLAGLSHGSRLEPGNLVLPMSFYLGLCTGVALGWTAAVLYCMRHARRMAAKAIRSSPEFIALEREFERAKTR